VFEKEYHQNRGVVFARLALTTIRIKPEALNHNQQAISDPLSAFLSW